MSSFDNQFEGRSSNRLVTNGLLENRGDDPYYCNIYSRKEAFEPGTDDVAALEVAAMNAPEGLIFPEQRAYFCTLAWCERGSCTVMGKGCLFEIKAGEVGVIDTGVHFSISAGPEGAEGYYLLMDGSRCDQLLVQAKLWPGAFRFREVPVEWLNMIAHSLTQKDRQAMASHIGYQVFLQTGEQVREAFPHPLLYDACQYMQVHWADEQLNVEAILKQVDASRSMLSALFKEHLGQSPLQYLNAIKLVHARTLLAGSIHTIAEVAVRCGLRDASYFSNWFRKQTGMTPSQFREGASRL